MCHVTSGFSQNQLDTPGQLTLGNIKWLQCQLAVSLSPEEGQCQPVCPKVLVKCKSSNIQHEHVGEWFEFLRQIPFVNIAINNIEQHVILNIFDWKADILAFSSWWWKGIKMSEGNKGTFRNIEVRHIVFFCSDIPHRWNLETPYVRIVRFTSRMDEVQHLLELKDFYIRQRLLAQFPPSSTLNETRLRGHTWNKMVIRRAGGISR